MFFFFNVVQATLETRRKGFVNGCACMCLLAAVSECHGLLQNENCHYESCLPVGISLCLASV